MLKIREEVDRELSFACERYFVLVMTFINILLIISVCVYNSNNQQLLSRHFNITGNASSVRF